MSPDGTGPLPGEPVWMVAFADGPGGGNPVPIVLDADRLSDEEMQRAAAGFGFETAFVLSPESGGDCRMRYFVPRQEFSMCVHATVAAVTLLMDQGVLPPGEATVETPLRTRRATRDREGRVMVEMGRREIVRPTPSAAEVADVLGVPPASIGGPLAQIRTVSVARPKTIVPLTGEDVLDTLSPRFAAAEALCDRYRSTGLYAVAVSDGDRYQVAARQFPCRAGYPEDPATGVAAGALAAYLADQGVRPSTADGYRIAQGRAMGRPSLIVARPPDGAGPVWVGGQAGSLASVPAPIGHQ